MEPIYNPYSVYHNQRDVVLMCVIDDANPLNAVTYEWNSPSGTVKTQNLTIPTVTNLHSGQYSCTATNIAGTSNKSTKQIHVHYGPKITNISNQHDITEGNNLVVSPIVNANPVSKLVWWTKQNDADFRYDGFVLRINNINRMSSGNYSCYVMNTLTPSGMSEINKTTHQMFSVNVVSSLRQEMFAGTKENTGMFLAGIVTLLLGLLSLVASVLFIVRNSLKNKTRNSSKNKDYNDVHRSNPAFTDPYTTLQSDIETRASQDKSVYTYEECGRYPEAHAYSSVENIESEQGQHQQHSGNTYEECGKRIEAHADEYLNK